MVATAAEFGGDGPRSRCAWRAGRIGKVRGDERISPDIVAIPHGWATPNVSELTSADADIDPLTGMVRQSAIPVVVRPCNDPAVMPSAGQDCAT